MSCPDSNALALMMMDGLSDDPTLEAHVAACDACRAKLEKMKDALAPAASELPPEDAFRGLKQRIAESEAARARVVVAMPLWKRFLRSRAPLYLSAAACIAIIASIVVPNMMQARKHGNETTAIGALKTVATSDSVFRESDKDENGALDYGEIRRLESTQMVDSVLGGGTKQGYLFRATSDHDPKGEMLWFASEQPRVAQTTGDRYFEANQQAIIEYSTNRRFVLKNGDITVEDDFGLADGRIQQKADSTTKYELAGTSVPQVRNKALASRDAGIELARRLATSSELRPRAPTITARYDGPEEKDLPLEALRISTVLMATRARVLIDATFANPSALQLQGTLRVRLPDGASPCSLATFQGTGTTAADPSALLPPPIENPATLLARTIALPSTWSSGATQVSWGELRPARVVEEQQAKVIYEQVTRRRVDPALMEWSGGNNFTTRIFPIAAHGRKRAFFVYDAPAGEIAGRAAIALPVPAKLPPAFRCEVAADPLAFASAALVTSSSETALDGATFLRGALDAKAASGDGSFLIAATPRDRRVRAGFAETPSVPGAEVHARLAPSVKLSDARATGDAVFVLDTSLSQRTGLAARMGKLLRAILERDATIARFRVVTFDVAARSLTDGWRANTEAERARALEDVEHVWLEGATNLESALALLDRTIIKEERPTFFLLSDAQLTWGVDDPRELERAFPRLFGSRWICYQIGDAAVNRPIVDRLARAGGRVVTIATAQELDAAALAHRASPVLVRSVKVEGGDASDLVVAGAPRALFPGQTLDVGFRAAAGVDPRATTIALETEAGVERFALTSASPNDAVAARAWAELATNALLELGDRDADSVALALSQTFAIANRVASFLILETDAEYVQHKLEPEKLDVAKLAASAAARDARRPIGGPDLSKLDARVLAFLERLKDARTPAWPAQPRWPGQPYPKPTGTKWPERIDPLAVWRESERVRDYEADSLRILSSIVEEQPRDARALRLVAFTLMDRGRWEDAAALFARVRALRPFEPQALLGEAIALEALGRAADAALRFECVLAGEFDPRTQEFARQSARRLYGRLLAAAGADAWKRAEELGLGREPAFESHEVHLLWSIDDTDVDLHVDESGSHEHVFYSHRDSQSGGHLLWDNTAGLGPEIYVNAKREPAELWVNYFGTSSVEGTVPAATLIVYFRGGEVVVRASVLADRRDKVVLWQADRAEKK